MSGVKTIFTGPPKPKRDKKAEAMLAEQTRLEKLRAESADRALASSRRARNAGGGFGRAGLVYTGPQAGPGATLG